MRTLQSEMVKHRNFISQIRHTNSDLTKGQKMQHEISNSRSTGGVSANKRYKRTPEELDQDIAKVDEMVASGKYNQIEALNAVGLQSSVYHYRKRNQQQDPAKSLKPRKFASRPGRKVTAESYATKKQELLNTLVKKPDQAPVAKESLEVQKLQTELEQLKARYKKLKEYVVENVILG